jgi:hypothetical protein
MVRSSIIEQRLVASVKSEHLHGLRICPRLWRWCCAAASAASLLCTLLGSGLFSAVAEDSTFCGQGLRCSLAVDLRASLLVLRSGGLRDCLAARGVSFAGVISLLFSAGRGGVAADTEASSSSPEPDGRLLIERYGGDARIQQHSKDRMLADALVTEARQRGRAPCGRVAGAMARALKKSR